MNRKNIFYLLLLSLGLAACLRSTTPPAPDMAAGAYENVAYEFLHWQEGLNVMVWHEAMTDSNCSSSSESNVDTSFVQCQIRTAEGFEYTWQIATKNGRSADVMLNGQPYDLADGNVFLITIENGLPDVQQLPRDLSDVEPNYDSITQFGLADADISQFIEDAAPNN